MNPCFAIIDRNTLSRMALEKILMDTFSQVEVVSYGSMEKFIRDSNRHFVHFFVSSDILFTNIDEFEYLKHMTTVLSQGHNRRIEEAGYVTLDISMTGQSIFENILKLHSSGHCGGPQTLTARDSEGIREILSKREKDVLRLMIKGLINKEIAEELNISLTTVIFHRNNICDKLQTRSIGKMTIFAVLSGIIDINDI